MDTSISLHCGVGGGCKVAHCFFALPCLKIQLTVHARHIKGLLMEKELYWLDYCTRGFFLEASSVTQTTLPLIFHRFIHIIHISLCPSLVSNTYSMLYRTVPVDLFVVDADFVTHAIEI